jgi:PAS domain S-box-containing protein
MHRMLERQLKRVLGLEADQWPQFVEQLKSWADRAADENADQGDGLARALFGLPTLLERVSETYAQQDRDLALIRRSLELSSEELSSVNQKLRDDATASAQALAALQRAFDAMRKEGGADAFGHSEDLVIMAEQVAGLTRDRERMRLALAKSEERFDLAMRGANDGVWDWDLETNTVYYSPRWKAMLGHDEDEIGPALKEWSDRVHPEDLDMALAMVNAHLSGITPHFEVTFRFRHKDGHYLWMLSRGLAVRDAAGKAVRMVGTHTDVSAQKRAEEALIQLKDAAEAANRAKSEFLANMSHEIRTPMNGVLGMLTLALDTPLSEEQHEYLDLARSSADALLHILNDILDFSKIEAGRMDVHLEGIDPRELANELARFLEPRCREKGLSFVCKIDPTLPARVLADPVRLRQVLVNLLGNAIKFTARGEICLSLRRETDPSGDALRIGVSDSGIGIAPERQAEVFKAFTQADNSITRRFGGTGLGLTISNRLVQLMGGHMGSASQLRLDSELGRGSEFFFTLPLLEPTASAATPEVSPDTAAETTRPLHILLAEDNPINQKLAVTLLGRAGHRVSVAEDGDAALRALAQESFDLILMDMQMPGLSGLEATRQIRANAGANLDTPRVPIVALTANAFAEDRDACMAAGMDGFVSKPIRREELFAAIAAALQASEQSVPE